MNDRGPYVLGLTGAIGSGKSNVARFFRRLGICVSCSDSYVTYLYDNDGLFRNFLNDYFPHCFDEGGILDKIRLRHYIFAHPPARHALERHIHPRVRQFHRQTIDQGLKSGQPLVVLDVPLLFESGMDTLCDGVLVTVCQEILRRARVLTRPHMTPVLLDLIESSQMDPDEKKRRATFWVDTSVSPRQTFKDVQAQLAPLCERYTHEFT